MNVYYLSSNNGVTALVSRETFLNIIKKSEILHTLKDERHRIPGRDYTETISKGLRHIPETPVFTFVDGERACKSPWFTGDRMLLDALLAYLEKSGHVIFHSSFNVPFSNGCELGIHGERAMTDELKYVTTQEQFKQSFGISMTELMSMPPKTLPK